MLKRRDAEVVAISTGAKRDALRHLGAARVLDRADDPIATLGAESMDVVIDNVGGAAFGGMLKLLRRGGRYVSSGAIAGPVVALDLRDMYLKDIALIGCTAWDAPVFPDLVSYVERGEIRPLLAATYPLEVVEAARWSKAHPGLQGDAAVKAAAGTWLLVIVTLPFMP